MERVKQRTEAARRARQARVLRTAWQTHGGMTWQDAAVAALATAAAVAVAHAWSPLWGPAQAAEPATAQEQPQES